MDTPSSSPEILPGKRAVRIATPLDGVGHKVFSFPTEVVDAVWCKLLPYPSQSLWASLHTKLRNDLVDCLVILLDSPQIFIYDLRGNTYEIAIPFTAETIFPLSVGLLIQRRSISSFSACSDDVLNQEGLPNEFVLYNFFETPIPALQFSDKNRFCVICVVDKTSFYSAGARTMLLCWDFQTASIVPVLLSNSRLLPQPTHNMSKNDGAFIKPETSASVAALLSPGLDSTTRSASQAQRTSFYSTMGRNATHLAISPHSDTHFRPVQEDIDQQKTCGLLPPNKSSSFIPQLKTPLPRVRASARQPTSRLPTPHTGGSVKARGEVTHSLQSQGHTTPGTPQPPFRYHQTSPLSILTSAMDQYPHQEHIGFEFGDNFDDEVSDSVLVSQRLGLADFAHDAVGFEPQWSAGEFGATQEYFPSRATTPNTARYSPTHTIYSQASTSRNSDLTYTSRSASATPDVGRYHRSSPRLSSPVPALTFATNTSPRPSLSRQGSPQSNVALRSRTPPEGADFPNESIAMAEDQVNTTTSLFGTNVPIPDSPTSAFASNVGDEELLHPKPSVPVRQYVDSTQPLPPLAQNTSRGGVRRNSVIGSGGDTISRGISLDSSTQRTRRRSLGSALLPFEHSYMSSSFEPQARGAMSPLQYRRNKALLSNLEDAVNLRSNIHASMQASIQVTMQTSLISRDSVSKVTGVSATGRLTSIPDTTTIGDHEMTRPPPVEMIAGTTGPYARETGRGSPVLPYYDGSVPSFSSGNTYAQANAASATMSTSPESVRNRPIIGVDKDPSAASKKRPMPYVSTLERESQLLHLQYLSNTSRLNEADSMRLPTEEGKGLSYHESLRTPVFPLHTSEGPEANVQQSPYSTLSRGSAGTSSPDALTSRSIRSRAQGHNFAFDFSATAPAADSASDAAAFFSPASHRSTAHSPMSTHISVASVASQTHRSASFGPASSRSNISTPRAQRPQSQAFENVLEPKAVLEGTNIFDTNESLPRASWFPSFDPGIHVIPSNTRPPMSLNVGSPQLSSGGNFRGFISDLQVQKVKSGIQVVHYKPEDPKRRVFPHIRTEVLGTSILPKLPLPTNAGLDAETLLQESELVEGTWIASKTGALLSPEQGVDSTPIETIGASILTGIRYGRLMEVATQAFHQGLFDYSVVPESKHGSIGSVSSGNHDSSKAELPVALANTSSYIVTPKPICLEELSQPHLQTFGNMLPLVVPILIPLTAWAVTATTSCSEAKVRETASPSKVHELRNGPTKRQKNRYIKRVSVVSTHSNLSNNHLWMSSTPLMISILLIVEDNILTRDLASISNLRSMQLLWQPDQSLFPISGESIALLQCPNGPSKALTNSILNPLTAAPTLPSLGAILHPLKHMIPHDIRNSHSDSTLTLDLNTLSIPQALLNVASVTRQSFVTIDTQPFPWSFFHLFSSELQKIPLRACGPLDASRNGTVPPLSGLELSLFAAANPTSTELPFLLSLDASRDGETLVLRIHRYVAGGSLQHTEKSSQISDVRHLECNVLWEWNCTASVQKAITLLQEHCVTIPEHYRQKIVFPDAQPGPIVPLNSFCINRIANITRHLDQNCLLVDLETIPLGLPCESASLPFLRFMRPDSQLFSSQKFTHFHIPVIVPLPLKPQLSSLKIMRLLTAPSTARHFELQHKNDGSAVSAFSSLFTSLLSLVEPNYQQKLAFAKFFQWDTLFSTIQRTLLAVIQQAHSTFLAIRGESENYPFLIKPANQQNVLHYVGKKVRKQLHKKSNNELGEAGLGVGIFDTEHNVQSEEYERQKEGDDSLRAFASQELQSVGHAFLVNLPFIPMQPDHPISPASSLQILVSLSIVNDESTCSAASESISTPGTSFFVNESLNNIDKSSFVPFTDTIVYSPEEVPNLTITLRKERDLGSCVGTVEDTESNTKPRSTWIMSIQWKVNNPLELLLDSQKSGSNDFFTRAFTQLYDMESAESTGNRNHCTLQTWVISFLESVTTYILWKEASYKAELLQEKLQENEVQWSKGESEKMFEVLNGIYHMANQSYRMCESTPNVNVYKEKCLAQAVIQSILQVFQQHESFYAMLSNALPSGTLWQDILRSQNHQAFRSKVDSEVSTAHLDTTLQSSVSSAVMPTQAITSVPVQHPFAAPPSLSPESLTETLISIFTSYSTQKSNGPSLLQLRKQTAQAVFRTLYSLAPTFTCYSGLPPTLHRAMAAAGDTILLQPDNVPLAALHAAVVFLRRIDLSLQHYTSSLRNIPQARGLLQKLKSRALRHIYGSVPGGSGLGVLTVQGMTGTPTFSVGVAAAASAILIDTILGTGSLEMGSPPGVDLDGLQALIARRTFHSRFFPDSRIISVARLLSSSTPRRLTLQQDPTASDHELSNRQQYAIFLNARKITANSIGRGMLTYATCLPSLFDPVPVPVLTIAAYLDQKSTPALLDVTTLSATNYGITTWPEFHNGFAAGIRLVTPLAEFDTEGIMHTILRLRTNNPLNAVNNVVIYEEAIYESPMDVTHPVFTTLSIANRRNSGPTSAYTSTSHSGTRQSFTKDLLSPLSPLYSSSDFTTKLVSTWVHSHRYSDTSALTTTTSGPLPRASDSAVTSAAAAAVDPRTNAPLLYRPLISMATSTGTGAHSGLLPPNAAHGGLFLALGINGLLRNLSPTDIYELLLSTHTAFVSGVLLGLAIGQRSSGLNILFRAITLHLPALLPAFPQLVGDISIPPTVQSVSLAALGFLFLQTSPVRMATLLLREIGTKAFLAQTTDQESYVLMAGFSLGLTYLGRGDLETSNNVHHRVQGASATASAFPMEFTSKLLGFINGKAIADVEDVEGAAAAAAVYSYLTTRGSRIDTTITTPAAFLALGLIYLRTNNKHILKSIPLPKTLTELENFRPEVLSLLVVVRNLIMWNQHNFLEFDHAFDMEYNAERFLRDNRYHKFGRDLCPLLFQVPKSMLSMDMKTNTEGRHYSVDGLQRPLARQDSHGNGHVKPPEEAQVSNESSGEVLGALSRLPAVQEFLWRHHKRSQILNFIRSQIPTCVLHTLHRVRIKALEDLDLPTFGHFQQTEELGSGIVPDIQSFGRDLDHGNANNQTSTSRLASEIDSNDLDSRVETADDARSQEQSWDISLHLSLDSTFDLDTLNDSLSLNGGVIQSNEGIDEQGTSTLNTDAMDQESDSPSTATLTDERSLPASSARTNSANLAGPPLEWIDVGLVATQYISSVTGALHYLGIRFASSKDEVIRDIMLEQLAVLHLLRASLQKKTNLQAVKQFYLALSAARTATRILNIQNIFSELLRAGFPSKQALSIVNIFAWREITLDYPGTPSPYDLKHGRYTSNAVSKVTLLSPFHSDQGYYPFSLNPQTQALTPYTTRYQLKTSLFPSTLHSHLLTSLSVPRLALDNAISTVQTAVGMLMAGSGDLTTYRQLLFMRQKSDASVLYGSYLANSMAVGFLFLSSGSATLSRSDLAVASLLVSTLGPWPVGTASATAIPHMVRNVYALAVDQTTLTTFSVDKQQLFGPDAKAAKQAALESLFTKSNEESIEEGVPKTVSASVNIAVTLKQMYHDPESGEVYILPPRGVGEVDAEVSAGRIRLDPISVNRPLRARTLKLRTPCTLPHPAFIESISVDDPLYEKFKLNIGSDIIHAAAFHGISLAVNDVQKSHSLQKQSHVEKSQSMKQMHSGMKVQSELAGNTSTLTKDELLTVGALSSTTKRVLYPYTLFVQEK